VAVQGSHDADARKHRWAAERRHQDHAPQRSGLRSPSCAALGLLRSQRKLRGQATARFQAGVGGAEQCRLLRQERKT
jgi:hypothetical protein